MVGGKRGRERVEMIHRALGNSKLGRESLGGKKIASNLVCKELWNLYRNKTKHSM